MAASATGAATSTGAATNSGSSAGGMNPFQIATNLYAEKNLQGMLSGQATSASAQQYGGSINAGQFLRSLHLMVRTAVAGADVENVGGVAIADCDGSFAVVQNADLTNVDGSEILYNMSGAAHYFMQKYAKPWLCDRALAYDYQPLSATSLGSFTLDLMPEIRFTAGVLANTDTRSQYRFDYTIAPITLSAGTSFPTVNVIPYMDAWAQPDANDLQGTPNQPVPPGVNLQVKRRHQIFSGVNAAGDNTVLSTLTGNAIRCALMICRNSSGQRVDGMSDPIYWYLDNRSLGRLNPDMVRHWAEDQYNSYDLYGKSNIAPSAFYATANNAADGLSGAGNYAGAGSEDTGVYTFPRFMNPGDLYGQGWLYTANSTKLSWESSGANEVATWELVEDEVYPVGSVDPTLVDI